MESIDLAILAQLQAYQHCHRWIIAYSGGIDSTVLLYSLVSANQRLQSPKPIIALHINHQLSEFADQWQQHCQQTAQSLNIDYFSQKADVFSKGKGVEAAARDIRYQVFEQYLQPGDCLLMGQHRNDQAETLLFRLLRGAGVKGLAAMPISRPLGKAMLLRPFLDTRREDIECYAREHQLQWVDDDSNVNERYDRNYLRHQVLPVLKQRWPGVEGQLSATAVRMREADQLLEQLAQSDLQQLNVQMARCGSSLDLGQLVTLISPEASLLNQGLSDARVNNLLRYWCFSMGYPLPQSEHLEHIKSQFLNGNHLASSACVSWKQTECRQFGGRLYLMSTLPKFTEPNSVLKWNMETSLSLGVAGALHWVDVDQQDNSALRLVKRPYTIRWRQGGERCTPSHRQRSQTVKKLLQEYGLETWLRGRVPLIYMGTELVAVGDLWVNKGYEAPSETTGLLWQLGASNLLG